MRKQMVIKSRLRNSLSLNRVGGVQESRDVGRRSDPSRWLQHYFAMGSMSDCLFSSKASWPRQERR